MIGWLRGTLRVKRPPRLIVEAHGVGYEVEAPMTTFYVLPGLGEEVSLHTHQVVREDSHSLYGFHGERERDVFRMLLRVNGVGAKVGLAILSGMDAAALSRCISEADTVSLIKLPGIGKKMAERLVIEMRDRLDPAASKSAVTSPLSMGGTEPVSEAISALVALGFKPQEATRRVHHVEAEGLACEEIVRRALRAAAG